VAFYRFLFLFLFFFSGHAYSATYQQAMDSCNQNPNVASGLATCVPVGTNQIGSQKKSNSTQYYSFHSFTGSIPPQCPSGQTILSSGQCTDYSCRSGFELSTSIGWCQPLGCGNYCVEEPASCSKCSDNSSLPGSTSPGSTSPGSTSPGSSSDGSTSPGSSSDGSTSPGTSGVDVVVDLTPVVNAVNSAAQTVKSSVDPVKSSTDSVKLSVDAVKTSTDAVKNAVNAAAGQGHSDSQDLKGAVNGTTDAVNSNGQAIKGALDGIKDELTKPSGSLNTNTTPTGFGDSSNQLANKKTEFTNYIQTVQSEAQSLLSLSISGGGGGLPIFNFGSVWGVPLSFDMTRFTYEFSLMGLCIFFICALISIRTVMDK